MIDYTLVVGVDKKHLEQLSYTWPTWKRHKPSLLDVPMVVFRDRHQVQEIEIRKVVDHPNLSVVTWPLESFDHRYDYRLPGKTKWDNEQRYKMLAGFVYVPPVSVMTRYWLKVDTDTVADGNDDWIDDSWFDDCPAIVAHPWPYTKPPNQMIKLDDWVDRNKLDLPMLNNCPPLNLRPNPGSGCLRHHRIISWCGFFHTKFTAQAAAWAARTGHPGSLPVQSQDGYLYYCAKRLGFVVVRAGMKRRGWQHWSTMGNIRKFSEKVLR